MTLSDVAITTVWRALGGPELRGRRGVAWWRGGQALSVAIDADRGTWYDHRNSVGGGVLALVEISLGCSRSDALRWLEQECGLDPQRPLTPHEHAIRSQAPDMARTLADFARGLDIHTARCMALADTLMLDPELVADWHRQAHVVRTASPSDIAQLWREMPMQRAAVEALGRADRIDAERTTSAIVEMITAAQQREAA